MVTPLFTISCFGNNKYCMKLKREKKNKKKMKPLFFSEKEAVI